MSDGVVAFPGRPAVIWVCACGCASFLIREDGEAECCACEAICQTDAEAGWYDRVKAGPERAAEKDAPVVDVNANGSVDFARRRVAKMANDPTACIVAVVRSGGEVSLWTCCDGPAQREWGRRMLSSVSGLFDFQTGEPDAAEG
jgi:hypothetical protein